MNGRFRFRHYNGHTWCVHRARYSHIAWCHRGSYPGWPWKVNSDYFRARMRHD